MKSNVKLRSNVYLRLPGPVREDPKYRSMVHGREALRKLLNKIERFNTPDRATRWLTEYQLKEWSEVLRCSDCETQVVGRVRKGQAIMLEFRCGRGRCPHQDRI